MSNTIAATFDVTGWDEHQFDASSRRDRQVDAAKVTESYRGDISADSLTEWLMSYSDDGTACFVGLERIVGTVGAREGTLVVQHVGRFEDGAAKAGPHGGRRHPPVICTAPRLQGPSLPPIPGQGQLGALVRLTAPRRSGHGHTPERGERSGRPSPARCAMMRT